VPHPCADIPVPLFWSISCKALVCAQHCVSHGSAAVGPSGSDMKSSLALTGQRAAWSMRWHHVASFPFSGVVPPLPWYRGSTSQARCPFFASVLLQLCPQAGRGCWQRYSVVPSSFRSPFRAGKPKQCPPQQHSETHPGAEPQHGALGEKELDTGVRGRNHCLRVQLHLPYTRNQNSYF